jgi:hypothetical protein
LTTFHRARRAVVVIVPVHRRIPDGGIYRMAAIHRGFCGSGGCIKARTNEMSGFYR